MAVTQEEYEKLKAHAAGLDAANLQNQTALDAALQKHKDDSAAHAAELNAHDAKCAELIQEVSRLRAQEREAATALIEKLNAEHLNVIAEMRKNFAEQHDKAMKEQWQVSRGEIAELKAKILIPAQRDLHARQQADLAAKHQAEIDALK